jgi:hypothetical protein
VDDCAAFDRLSSAVYIAARAGAVDCSATFDLAAAWLQDGSDPVSALVDVADDAQDALMHALCAAWPVCPVHQLGAHARKHEAAAVWWCSGDGGHTVTAIGHWQGR